MARSRCCVPSMTFPQHAQPSWTASGCRTTHPSMLASSRALLSRQSALLLLRGMAPLPGSASAGAVSATARTVAAAAALPLAPPGFSRSFYKRPLPCPPAIEFSSDEGKAVFAEAMAAGTMTSFFKLIEQFHTQVRIHHQRPPRCYRLPSCLPPRPCSAPPGRACVLRPGLAVDGAQHAGHRPAPHLEGAVEVVSLEAAGGGAPRARSRRASSPRPAAPDLLPLLPLLLPTPDPAGSMKRCLTAACPWTACGRRASPWRRRAGRLWGNLLPPPAPAPPPRPPASPAWLPRAGGVPGALQRGAHRGVSVWRCQPC